MEILSLVGLGAGIFAIGFVSYRVLKLSKDVQGSIEDNFRESSVNLSESGAKTHFNNQSHYNGYWEHDEFTVPTEEISHNNGDWEQDPFAEPTEKIEQPVNDENITDDDWQEWQEEHQDSLPDSDEYSNLR